MNEEGGGERGRGEGMKMVKGGRGRDQVIEKRLGTEVEVNDGKRQRVKERIKGK